MRGTARTAEPARLGLTASLVMVAGLLCLASLALVSRAEGAIYMAEGTDFGGAIERANLDGSEDHLIITGTYEFGAVAVDDAHIYWLEGGTYCTPCPDGSIGRANLDGTDADPDFITGIHEPSFGLAVDGEHIYWSHGGIYGFPGTAIGR